MKTFRPFILSFVLISLFFYGVGHAEEVAFPQVPQQPQTHQPSQPVTGNPSPQSQPVSVQASSHFPPTLEVLDNSALLSVSKVESAPADEIVLVAAEEPKVYEYLDVPEDSVEGLKDELKAWWKKKNEATEKKSPYDYRTKMIDGSMQTLHQKELLELSRGISAESSPVSDDLEMPEENPAPGFATYQGHTYANITSGMVGKNASELLRNLARNGQIQLQITVHYEAEKQENGTYIYTATGYEVSIAILVSADTQIEFIPVGGTNIV